MRRLASTAATAAFVIAAMGLESFHKRVQNYAREKLVVVVGDRVEIQDLAIRERVRVLIVTGGLPVSQSLPWTGLGGVRHLGQRIEAVLALVAASEPHPPAPPHLGAAVEVQDPAFQNPMEQWRPLGRLPRGIRAGKGQHGILHHVQGIVALSYRKFGLAQCATLDPAQEAVEGIHAFRAAGGGSIQGCGGQGGTFGGHCGCSGPAGPRAPGKT